MPDPEPTDADLLHLTSTGDRNALGELVVRYVDLVHAAAARQTTDAATAAGVTQAVFLVLAEKAGSVRGPALPAWLVQTTLYTAANVRRTERRRRRRERSAARPEPVMPTDIAESDPLLPLLDDAIASLAATDRVAVVERYLLGRDLPAVAASLGTSPEAARKRVERAVTKLRVYFARHGAGAVPAVAVTGVLSAAAPSSAPAALVATVVAAAASPHLVPASSAVTAKGRRRRCGDDGPRNEYWYQSDSTSDRRRSVHGTDSHRFAHGPIAVGPALPAVRAARPTSRPAKPVPGEILWTDGDRIAAMPSPGPTEDHPYGSVIYLMDDRTQFLIMKRTQSTTAPDGRVTELHYASKPGGRKDLKVGLRTHIIADGETATRIMVFFDDPQQP